MGDSAKKLEQTRGKGTYTAPYKREDGSLRVKWGLSVPVQFVERFRRFVAQLPLGTTGSDWVVKALNEAMDREAEQ